MSSLETLSSWEAVRAHTGLSPAHSLKYDLQRVAAAVLLLFGLMFGIGALLLLRWDVAPWMGLMTVLGGGGLWLLRRRGAVSV